jgi:hypothetical protein
MNTALGYIYLTLLGLNPDTYSMSFAIKNNQTFGCKLIVDNEYGELCYEVVTERIKEGSNGGLCSNLRGENIRNECYLGISRKNRDYSLCDRILNDEERLMMCYKALVDTETDISKCSLVIEKYKDRCNDRVTMNYSDFLKKYSSVRAQ